MALTLMAPTFALAGMTIADVAPPSSVFIAGIDDYTAMRASFDKTGLKKVWDDPAVQAWIKSQTKEAMEEFDSTLADLGMKREDIVPPTGMAGMAVWMTSGDDPTVPPMQMLWTGDFGDNAENLHTKIVGALEKAEGENKLKFESEDFAGGTLITVTEIEQDDAADAPDDADEADDAEDGDDWEDWEDMEEAEGPEYKTMYYGRVGSSLMVTTNQRDAEDAMNRLAGKGDSSARGGADFGKAMSLIGPSQVYFVMLAQPLYDLAAEKDKEAAAAVADDPSNPPSMQIMQTLGALGISQIRSASVGVNFDGDKGMAESVTAIHCPEIKGLMTLFAADPRAIAAPSFATADASSFSTFQIRFEQLIPVLKEAAQTLPTELAGQAGFIIPAIEGQMGPIFANIGPELHIIQSYTKPYAADSAQSVFAVSVKDAAALGTELQMRAQSFGLIARDFQGAQIWSFPAEGGAFPLPPGAEDLGIGLGFSHLFIGKTAAIEGAMLLAGNPDAPDLGSDPGFTRAISVLKSPGLSFSFTNMAKTIDYAKWMVANYDKIQAAQFEEMLASIDDPEFKKMMEENRPETPEWMKDFPDLSIVSREVGNFVGEMHITPDGFVGNSYLLRPEK